MQQINGGKNKEAWYQYIVLELVSTPHIPHSLLIKVISMNREKVTVTNLSSENNFADVSTECSSRHQGESDDDWSIQLKRRLSYFPNASW